MNLLADAKSFVSASIQLPTFPLRPERTRREPVMLTRAQVQKKMHWNDAAFEAALTFNFPSASKRFLPHENRLELTWSDVAVERWADETRQRADVMHALVAKAIK